MSTIVEKTHWEEDIHVNNCTTCKKNFTALRRKHHCRSCGRIFCHQCSPNQIPVSFRQIEEPARVCLLCEEIITLTRQIKEQGGVDLSHASRRLSEISEDPPACHTIAAGLGMGSISPMLCALLSSDNVQCRSTAALLLARLAQFGTYRIVISTRESAVPLLVRLASMTDPAAMYSAATALNQLAVDDNARLEIGQSGAIPVLVGQLACDDPQIHQAALSAIGTIALSEENRVLVHNADAIPAIMRAALSGTVGGGDGPTVAGCACVSVLCQSDICRDTVAQEKGLTLFGSAARSDDVSLQRVAINGLGNLARCDSVREELSNNPSLIGLLLSLCSLNADLFVRLQALAAMTILAEDVRTRKAMLGLGALRTLLNLFIGQHSDTGFQCAVAMALTAIIADDQTKETFMADKRALSTILALIQSPNSGSHIYGACLLSTLAENEACRVRIGQEGGLLPLFHILQRESPQAQIICARTLGFLGMSLTNSMKMVEFGVLYSLVNLMKSDDFNMQLLSSWTLCNLIVNATSATSKTHLNDADAISSLLNLTRTWSRAVQADGTSTKFSVNGEFGELGVTLSSPILPDLNIFHTLVDAPVTEVQVWLAWTLAMLSFSDCCCVQIATQAIAYVVRLGAIQSRDVQRGVAIALANTSAIVDDEGKSLLHGNSSVRKIIDFLSRSSYADIANVAKEALARIG